jgi:hypothetical protein
MLDDALLFPRRADDWLQTVVIGGVLGLLGFLFLPWLVVQGYLVRVVRSAVDDETAPSFTDWGELIVDGLGLFVLQFGAAVLLAVAFVILTAISALSESSVGVEIAGIIALIGLIALAALALGVAYLLPAAIVNFAIEGSLRAAFDAEAVLGGARTSDYAVAWLLAAFVGIGGSLLGGALSIAIVGVFILFYVQVVVSYLFGRGFASGLGRGAWAGTGASATRTDITGDDYEKISHSNRPARRPAGDAEGESGRDEPSGGDESGRDER